MKTEIKNFYFTYGTWKGYPYSNGWTRIEATSMDAAVKIFRDIHPDKRPGTINCCFIYTEEEFHETAMWRHGNLGAHEVETILMQHIDDIPF